MGTFLQTPAEDVRKTEGCHLQLGPERASTSSSNTKQSTPNFSNASEQLLTVQDVVVQDAARLDTMRIIKEDIFRGTQCKRKCYVVGMLEHGNVHRTKAGHRIQTTFKNTDAAPEMTHGLWCDQCDAFDSDVVRLPSPHRHVHELNECVRVELEEIKQHYKELFESIQITRASTNEKISSLLTQIEDLKAQLEGNLKVAARSSVKTKVLALGMYAINVEPIPPRLKNKDNAHLPLYQPS
ncbi:hypothetical protein Tco_0996716 [Tanacetum coccineum]